jgi:NAD-dependent DNA ligase
MNLVELLLGLFRWIGTPLEVNELVTHLSKLYELEEPTIVPLTHSEEEGEEAGIVEEELLHPGETPEEEVVQRLHREEWLRQLWAEIQQLRDPQRQALLLGFDPEMIQVFKAVAGAEEIAAALGLVPEELARCLPSLPLSNAAIQERLGLTQAQDVSNLRKAARERLQRRMEKRQEFSEAW